MQADIYKADRGADKQAGIHDAGKQAGREQDMSRKGKVSNIKL